MQLFVTLIVKNNIQKMLQLLIRNGDIIKQEMTVSPATQLVFVFLISISNCFILEILGRNCSMSGEYTWVSDEEKGRCLLNFLVGRRMVLKWQQLVILDFLFFCNSRLTLCDRCVSACRSF